MLSLDYVYNLSRFLGVTYLVTAEEFRVHEWNYILDHNFAIWEHFLTS